MSIFKNLSIAVLLLATTAPLNAQKLTLDNATQLATANIKQLKLAGAKTDAAASKVSQNKNAFIPQVTLSANYTRLSDNIEPFVISIPGFGSQALNPQILNQFTNRASIQYTVFGGLRNQNNLKTTQFLEAAAKLDAEKDALDVRFNAISAVLNLYKGQQTLKVVEDNLKLSDTRINDITNMYNAGMALQNDVLRTSLNKSNLELSKLDIESGLQTANYNLNILLGLPDATVNDIDEASLFPVAEDKAVAAWISEALVNRSDIKVADARLSISQTGVKNAQSAYMPTLSIGANYYYNNPNQRVFPQQDQFKYTWDAGATLSWNLTNLYAGGAQVREAKQIVTQNQIGTTIIEDGIKMEVNANYNGYTVAKAKIDVAQKALDQALENQRVVKNKVDNGLNLQTDLLDADAFVLQAQINLLNAKTDAQLAYFKLLKSVGR
jgi:outer membrane protein